MKVDMPFLPNGVGAASCGWFAQVKDGLPNLRHDVAVRSRVLASTTHYLVTSFGFAVSSVSIRLFGRIRPLAML